MRLGSSIDITITITTSTFTITTKNNDSQVKVVEGHFWYLERHLSHHYWFPITCTYIGFVFLGWKIHLLHISSLHHIAFGSGELTQMIYNDHHQSMLLSNVWLGVNIWPDVGQWDSKRSLWRPSWRIQKEIYFPFIPNVIPKIILVIMLPKNVNMIWENVNWKRNSD